MNRLAFFAALVIMTVSCQNNQERSKEINQDEISVTNKEFGIPKSFQIPTLTFEINPNSDTILAIGQNGTKLHIPQNAFINQCRLMIY